MDDTGHIRKRFARQTYSVLLIFLAIAFVQWIIVSLVERCRKIFRHFEIYCSATCSVAGILFTMFVFNENLRSKKIFSRAVAFLIVELLVFSMFVLIARTWIPDQMAFYFFCVLLMVVALIVGCHLSFTMDMTQYIAPLFLMSFILVTISIYFLVVNNFMEKLKPYAYLIFEICLTSVMTLSVMLHAQTISGDRMVQMSSDDSLLAALFLFNEFLAVYAMTFYWQINYNYFTSTDFLWMSTSTKHSHDTTPVNSDYDYDMTPDGQEWGIQNDTNYDWAKEMA